MPRKQKTGVVVSDKMQKSIVVEVTSTKQHPLYKKFIRVRKRFIAHDEENQAQNGDTVRIEESRPLSRRKSWVLSDILRVAPGHGLAIKHTATAVASIDEDEARRSADEQGSAPAAASNGAAPVGHDGKASVPAGQDETGMTDETGGGVTGTESGPTESTGTESGPTEVTDEGVRTNDDTDGNDEVQA